MVVYRLRVSLSVQERGELPIGQELQVGHESHASPVLSWIQFDIGSSELNSAKPQGDAERRWPHRSRLSRAFRHHQGSAAGRVDPKWSGLLAARLVPSEADSTAHQRIDEAESRGLEKIQHSHGFTAGAFQEADAVTEIHPPLRHRPSVRPSGKSIRGKGANRQTRKLCVCRFFGSVVCESQPHSIWRVTRLVMRVWHWHRQWKPKRHCQRSICVGTSSVRLAMKPSKWAQQVKHGTCIPSRSARILNWSQCVCPHTSEPAAGSGQWDCAVCAALHCLTLALDRWIWNWQIRLSDAEATPAARILRFGKGTSWLAPLSTIVSEEILTTRMAVLQARQSCKPSSCRLQDCLLRNAHIFEKKYEKSQKKV